MLVQMRGLEPPRPQGHQHLKLACLPIPPHLHWYSTVCRIKLNRNLVQVRGLEPPRP